MQLRNRQTFLSFLCLNNHSPYIIQCLLLMGIAFMNDLFLMLSSIYEVAKKRNIAILTNSDS